MSGNPIAQHLMDLSAAELRRELLGAATGRRSYGEARGGMLAYAGWLSGAEGIRPGDRVAVCLPKNLETVQLVYGILAAGAAYVPLQYQGPPARLGQILAATAPALLVTTRQMAAMVRAAVGPTPAGTRVVEVEADEEALAALPHGLPPARRIAEVSAQDLAILLFTSGSTGEPKGVMWSHRNISAAMDNITLNLQVTAADRFIGISALHYSSSEIFFPVIPGARVYLCSDRETAADHLAATMEREATTIWSTSATALRLLAEGGDLPARDLRALRLVVFFGERMPLAALRAAMNALPQTEFRNLYGATEAFGMAEHILARPLAADSSVLPLGRPRRDWAVSLRDEAGHEVDAGEIGEICVVGPCVAIGYWKDPELTAARRLPGIPDSYRTGDLGRRDADGVLWLVGRRDHQVKLNGHRFDLGEIEAAARMAPGVREAVAMIAGAGTPRAEVVLALLTDATGRARAEVEGAVAQISRQRLPRYARPSRIVALGEFPQLASGKIDRRALEKQVVRG